MEDLGGFIKQVPIGLLLAPIVFLVLYIVLLAVIFQRRAARRRLRQAEREQAMSQGIAPGVSNTMRNPQAIPMQAAADTSRSDRPQKLSMLSASTAIPEPDLDLLAAPPFAPLSAMSAMPPTPKITVPATKPEMSNTQPMPDINAERAPAMPSRPDPESLLALDSVDQIVEINAMPVSNSENQPSPADAVEVLRVWRDLSDGALIIQMGNARYRTMDEIAGADLTRRFSALVRELSAMANAAMPAPELPGAKARIGLLNQAQPDEAVPKSGVFRQLGRAAIGQNTAAAKGDNRAGGIADAVEEFLQYKLTDHPEFSTRSIHIRPASDGGVRIDVDGRSWSGIGDVTDIPVRDFLFSVMKEWEARQ